MSESPGGLYFSSPGLGLGLRVGISNRFSGDCEAAYPGPLQETTAAGISSRKRFNFKKSRIEWSKTAGNA